MTRKDKENIEYGASPRASIGLILASKAKALIEGRNFVSKEDIDYMAYPVLRHRLILTFEAERSGITPDQAIEEIIRKLK
jgi:MoxR-like ATPase